ncbi:hypothetical protein Bca101_059439 [Brassica carinata]
MIIIRILGGGSPSIKRPEVEAVVPPSRAEILGRKESSGELMGVDMLKLDLHCACSMSYNGFCTRCSGSDGGSFKIIDDRAFFKWSYKTETYSQGFPTTRTLTLGDATAIPGHRGFAAIRSAHST